MKTLLLNLLLISMSPVYAEGLESKIKVKNLELAIESMPPMKAHHQTVIDMLQSKINPEGVVIIENVIRSAMFIEMKDKESALKTINNAIKVAESVQSQQSDDFLMVEYNVEVINNAPYEIKEIKQIKKDINYAYRRENFPQTRDLLASLESELRMQAFNISVKGYKESLEKIKSTVSGKQFEVAQSQINQLLGTVVAENWSIPLPFIEAQTAISKAEDFKIYNSDKAKEKIKEAQYQLDRAMALGYVTGEEADFKMLNDKLKIIKKEMFKEQFKIKEFDFLRDKLIAYITKHMSPLKSQQNLARTKAK